MISVIEIRNPNWEHEQVNAGLIKNLRDTAPNSRISFWAGEEQSRCVNEIYDLAIHRIESHLINVPPRRGEPGEVEATYMPILEQLILEDNPSDVFVLATSAEVIRAVNEVSEAKKIHFHMVFHQRLERELMNATSDGQVNEPPIVSAINDAGTEYVHYISYSPYMKEYIGEWLPSEKINLFSFLHHPVVSACYECEKKCKDRHQVAIYGAAINQFSLDIVKKAATHTELKNCVFKVICDEKNEILKQKNVVNALKPGVKVVANTINKLIRESDFVLVPYDREQYKLTASGIFWDAIRNNVPVITMDSPYFRYYKSGNYGFFKENIAEIIELLEKGECWNQDYSSSLRQLVEDTTKDNLFWLSRMIHE